MVSHDRCNKTDVLNYDAGMNRVGFFIYEIPIFADKT